MKGTILTETDNVIKDVKLRVTALIYTLNYVPITCLTLKHALKTNLIEKNLGHYDCSL